MNRKEIDEDEKKWYLNAVLEAIKFPARIADLDTGLADVDRDALSHFSREKLKRNRRDKEDECERVARERRAFIKTPLFCDLQENGSVVSVISGVGLFL